MIDVLTIPWGPIGLLGLIYATFLYANLSRRLGAVTKMPPYYRGFAVATALLSVALVSHVERKAAFLSGDATASFLLSPWYGLLFFHMPLFLGILIDVVLVWRYWSWLLKEDL